MRQKLIIALTILIVLFTACSSGGGKNVHEEHEMNKDTSSHAITANDKEVEEVAVTFTHVDRNVSASLQEIVGHYLQIKNALADDNAKQAANGANAMEKVLNKLDKSLLTAEQKAGYDQGEDELKEHAEHVGKNSDNIKHQRSHFSMMSEVMYNLVKAFGAGQPIYHDHCPMYNENRGAMWLSETKEIKNPYFGAEMPRCGTVEEVIK
ncbi:MAG TPA: DUF3347 domain-containing protein [Chitinophagaceae bacterium]|nr:DUF3347 domain-containing protein [Chitinophagaceae bacterium]